MTKKETSIFAANPHWTERSFPIPEHDYRSKFQRDRDRILYSKEFRRLSGKTQVFVSGFDDNIRTRLTHTLEVAQIANTISRKLGFSTELTEAIALGHDVGHTPFGHAGERTLNYIMNGCIPLLDYEKNLLDSERGFKHNLQGAKVVCQLEKFNDSEPGLNLTKFTIWGIVNHTKKAYKNCEYFQEDTQRCRYENRETDCPDGSLKLDYYRTALKYNEENILDDKRDWTFEALVVGLSDEIAQRHHDIEDGIFAGIIDYKEIIEYIKSNFKLEKKYAQQLKNAVNSTGYGSKSAIIACISKVVIDMYVTDAIKSIQNILDNIRVEKGITTARQFYKKREEVYEYLVKINKDITNSLHFSDSLKESDKKFQTFLTTHILQSELAQSMDGKATYIIRKLIKAYLTNPQQLPDATIIRLVKELGAEDKIDITKEGATVASQARNILRDVLVKKTEKIRHTLLRVVCDYIAGMTDQYAYMQFNKLYGTNMANK